MQALDLSGNPSLGRDGLDQLLTALAQRKASGFGQNSFKLSLCDCGLEPPLPEIVDKDSLVVVTDPLVFLKAKQSCINKFVVMVELYGNCLCKTDLDSWTVL